MVIRRSGANESRYDHGRVTSDSRLILEPLRPEHAAEMVAVLSDPALYEFTGGEPPTLDELRARYERQAVGHSPDGSAEWLNWIVRTTDDGQAVGFVQATVVGGNADLAWLIGTTWQGRAYATEAAREMLAVLAQRGIGHFTAHIRADHQASARVAANLGLSPTDKVEDGEVVWRLLLDGTGRIEDLEWSR